MKKKPYLDNNATDLEHCDICDIWFVNFHNCTPNESPFKQETKDGEDETTLPGIAGQSEVQS